MLETYAIKMSLGVFLCKIALPVVGEMPDKAFDPTPIDFPTHRNSSNEQGGML
jgi:hypothetical protein